MTPSAAIDHFPLSSRAQYYLEKFGEKTAIKLKEEAAFWAEEGNLHRRNTLLRLLDEVLMIYPDLQQK